MTSPGQLSSGSKTGGVYAVVCPLAAGGMGRVDLVARREGRFFRLYARKRLRPELVDDPDVRRMFLDEARIAGLVRHPNVVSVVDLGEDRAGPFLVMEFVEGVSLAELVEDVSAREELLPLELCLGVAGQVAQGLHALHELRAPDGEHLQLVHRDISPQNILVGFDGIARVTDFGIAKALGRASRTNTGFLKGKIGYLSPEQLRFEEPDRRADLFAFGVVLFEMLSGRRLYESAHEMEGPRRILNEPPPDLADFREEAEPELVELLFQLLAKHREQRPLDAKAVARRLENMLAALVAGREAIETGAYVEHLFAEKRDALRQKIALVQSQGGGAVAGTETGTSALLAQSATVAGAPVLARRRRQRLLAAAIAAVAVAAAAGVATVLWVPRSPPPAPAAATPGPTAAVAATPRSPPHVVADAPQAPIERPRIKTKARSSKPAGRSPVASDARPPDDCRTPYTIDDAGNKKFKIHCLVDVRR